MPPETTTKPPTATIPARQNRGPSPWRATARCPGFSDSSETADAIRPYHPDVQVCGKFPPPPEEGVAIVTARPQRTEGIRSPRRAFAWKGRGWGLALPCACDVTQVMSLGRPGVCRGTHFGRVWGRRRAAGWGSRWGSDTPSRDGPVGAGGSTSDTGVGGAGGDSRSAAVDGEAGEVSALDTVAFDGPGLADVAADQTPTDASLDDAASASTCPGDRRPDEGFCNPTAARPCQLSTGAACRCESVCGGPQPLPGMDYVWICRQPEPAACPVNRPIQGTACPTEGLTCWYGYCSGWSARCQGGRWLVTFMPPPP